MEEVAVFVTQLAVTTALGFAIVLFDERRLPPERLARAWPPASRAAAIVAFGPLCLPIHFVRTRRSVTGFFLGIGWAVVLLIASEASSLAVLSAMIGPDAVLRELRDELSPKPAQKRR